MVPDRWFPDRWPVTPSSSTEPSDSPTPLILLGRKTSGAPATIDGYRRVRVKDKLYPGLIAGPGAVAGVVTGLGDDDLDLLDAFEDDFYERLRAPVLLSDGREVSAFTYVVPARNLHHVTDETWDREGFGRESLACYLEMVAGLPAGLPGGPGRVPGVPRRIERASVVGVTLVRTTTRRAVTSRMSTSTMSRRAASLARLWAPWPGVL